MGVCLGKVCLSALGLGSPGMEQDRSGTNPGSSSCAPVLEKALPVPRSGTQGSGLRTVYGQNSAQLGVLI